ncbi:MAG: peptidylprolyl isomerase [Pseudomonadota bacterium]
MATADTVAVTVNGVAITLGEVISARRQLPEELQRYPDEFLLGALVEQLRDQQLLAEAARDRGLDETRLLALALTNMERAALADAYMADELIRRVSEEEIQRVYEERYVDAEPVEEVRAAHILVGTEDEAKAVKAEIEGGADFAAVAGRASLDDTGSQGGALGWFARAEMAPAFADAAFDLSDGAISEPVKSPYGWHLIKLDGRRSRPVPPLSEVQGEIIGELSEAAQAAVLAELRAAADIETHEEAIPPAAIRDDKLLGD